MVTNNHYRWDFIGLSTDQKPTPATSEKVVDGSTFYCSDTSKLYVYCQDDWYERKPLGGGGGGGSYTAGTGIDITDDTISVDTETIQEKLTAGSNINISDNTISATDTTYTAGSNISISEGVISATDTTYSNFTGTDGTAAGSAGLVPAPATTDAGKFLKADGTWDTAGGGGDTVYSTKTTSDSSTGGAVYIGNLDSSQVEQADPTTTDNHYKYFWALPGGNSSTPVDSSINMLGDRASQHGIVMGAGASSSPLTYYSVAIGTSASTENSAANSAVAIGQMSTVYSGNGIAIGRAAKVNNTSYQNSIALGSFAQVGRKGEVNIGTGGNNVGYNNTDYRVIGGVHDGQDAHDAATLAQGNTLATSAPTTATAGVLGQLYTDTTGMHTYQCTAIDTTDPNNPSYTWTQRW